ncbi:23S rRNA (uracil(1939)-C(5))-methyltransferase RlmD [Miniphocaeibacter halophilus]|uniref:23S rRNA (Uracil(1939)-C(5))-methyltransferase RlmD n=1 Tax=Miniphocaeibacter halophilus TaxID=2931922 RepID=A0AC61MTS1_9FIRM|nr:23S rRNA (uracil(1939)-C(5))-methyltransferase RlmD [Miniphocaeibacter halophilus]QQK08055.1 23S rRNA (uracil(1939)-C(5))-methyltransferase RlmD [Miniphocaeibacter halophilus]
MKVENLEIIDITEQGQGVAKKDNLVYFVEDVVVGETVDIEVIEKKKNFFIGKKIRTLKNSPYYIESNCKYSKECTGCSLLNTKYSKQLELKKELVKNQISRIGNFNIENINIRGLEEPYYFRNKIELKVDENYKIGYYIKKSHKLVPIEECLVASKTINNIMDRLLELIKKYKIKGYNRNKNTGIIKNITIRSNYLDEIQLTITLSKDKFENKEEFIDEIFKIDEVIELYFSINNKKNSEVMGEKVKQYFSKKEFIDKVGELKFKISPKSFFQVNSLNTKNLYDIALKQMKLEGRENILDLYCGIGTTTLYFGKNAKTAIGVEIVEDAVKDANINKKLNKINNVEFVLGKSEEKIEKLLNNNIDIVIVDPPRKGLDKKLVDILGRSKIKKLEYISCNPATLSRDLKYLQEYGFKLQEIELCDMFPHTMHVEALALLTK